MKCTNSKCSNNLSPLQEKDELLFCSRHCANVARPRNKPASNIKRSVTLRKNFDKVKICMICNIEFITTSKIKMCCSKECGRKQATLSMLSNPIAMNNLRKSCSARIKQRYADGDTSIGWQTRTKESYPEKFFRVALEKKEISFKREERIGRWFADFLIGNLVLEIDGRQHNDRKEKDAEKDEYLKSQGYLVTRIKWRNPRTELGARVLLEQLDMALGINKS